MIRTLVATTALLAATTLLVEAQSARNSFKIGGSTNVKVLSHIPIKGFISVGDLEIEQELSRPYAYVGLARPVSGQAGFTVINLKDLEKSSVLYTWLIDNTELH